MRWSGLSFALVLAASPAAAEPKQARSVVKDSAKEDPKPAPPDLRVSGTRRTLAVLASATTGLLVRGVGSYLVGEKRAAKRLAVVGAIGLGAAIGGGVPVGVSGGYPPTMPLMPVLLVGAGALFTTWWADIGVAAGVSRIGVARTQSPWSIELATLFLSDPYRQAGLGRLGGRVEIGRVDFGASGLIDAEDEIRTAELNVRVRIFGAAATGEIADDGSRLIVRTGLRSHQDDGDRVELTTAEVEVLGRLDLHRLDRALQGSFIEMSTGIGVERASYFGGHDNGSILLGTFGWGIYLGHRGEAQVFYDHRRDSMVGGLAAGRAAGFVGSLGASLDWVFDPRWGAHLEIDVGNAWLTTLALRYRGGIQ